MRFIVGALILGVVVAQAPPPVPGAPGVVAPVILVSAVVESTKLASKEWRNYKGCDDTCLSLCLVNPADFDSKCSVLFSNATVIKAPPMEICKKASVVQDCTYQCSCACKRCSFCKQDLVNACEDSKNPKECLDHVIDQIITGSKCD